MTFDRSLLEAPSSYPKPPSPQLTADQQLKLKSLEDHFGREGFELSTTEGGSEKTDLSERECMFLSRETFLRFLTATKGDLHAARTRLEACIIWRRTVKIEDVQAMAEDCEPESRTGKNIVLGFTPQRRPVIYFFPNRNTTPVEERRAVHAIYMLERARDLMPQGTSSVIVVFNFAGKRQGPPTSISVARQVLNILSSHYPETLSLCVFQELPFIVKTFINIMWPFVDPVTKKKVKFGSSEGIELVQGGDMEAKYLLQECGGTLELPYDHDQYWSAMVETCLKKRQEQETAFRALGPARVAVEESLWRTGSSSPAEDAEAANSTRMAEVDEQTNGSANAGPKLDLTT